MDCKKIWPRRPCEGLRRTATRARRRRDLLKQFEPFGAEPHSKLVNPVVLPPGRAKLATKPAPTGSITPANHDRHCADVACCNAATVGKVVAPKEDQIRRLECRPMSVAFFRLRSAITHSPHRDVDLRIAAHGPAGFPAVPW